MKVSTDIHAGALADAAAQVYTSAAGGLGEFLTTAQDQATAVVNGAAGVFTGFWDGMTGLLS